MEVTCFRVTGPMGRAGIQTPANLVFFPLCSLGCEGERPEGISGKS